MTEEPRVVIEEFEPCYRAVQSRDPRFDGWFVTAVTSTHIYCRPSCPAITPKRANVRFYPTAAAAQQAGFRACRRCRPEVTPGSPRWRERADLVARAMRLVADGVVDREGVVGLARRLGYSERHLHRQLVAEVGAGPLALARAQRAQTARVLIETTDLPMSSVAFAAGFASIRQFNDTVRDVFAASPSVLRHSRRGAARSAPGTIHLRLPLRRPFDGGGLLSFLSARAVAGVEEADAATYRRSLSLPHGDAVVELTPHDDAVDCTLRLGDLRDLTSAVERCRRLLDLDADPTAVAEALGTDALLGPLVAATPGRRVPGAVDGSELAVRAVLGQQVSVAAARTTAAMLTERWGQPLQTADGGIVRCFPSAAVLAAVDPAALPLPASRAQALVGLCGALADGTLVLDPASDRAEVRARLLALRGIGPWTVDYIALRALGDPDAFLPTDLGVRHALRARGCDPAPAAVERLAARWRPWRAYATLHLWATHTPVLGRSAP